MDDLGKIIYDYVREIVSWLPNGWFLLRLWTSKTRQTTLNVTRMSDDGNVRESLLRDQNGGNKEGVSLVKYVSIQNCLYLTFEQGSTFVHGIIGSLLSLVVDSASVLNTRQHNSVILFSALVCAYFALFLFVFTFSNSEHLKSLAASSIAAIWISIFNFLPVIASVYTIAVYTKKVYHLESELTVWYFLQWATFVGKSLSSILLLLYAKEAYRDYCRGNDKRESNNVNAIIDYVDYKSETH